MAHTEGVIQYELTWESGPLPADFDPRPLAAAFRACRMRDWIGQSPDRYGGFAYGNLSVRTHPGFVISGTQTGRLPSLDRQDLSWVTRCETSANRIVASGPARPSSEAMTHNEVYAASPAVDAIIHIHSSDLWRSAEALRMRTTDPAAGYGTPAMAYEIRRLLEAEPEAGVIAMGGHEDGIIAYAHDMATAFQLLLDANRAAEAN